MEMMRRYLMIDVGAGTLDLLYYDASSGEHFKAVVKSPVRSLADTIENLKGNLVVTGVEMGGGRVSTVLKNRARTHAVVMSAEAAATVHHDPARVESAGIVITSAKEAHSLAADPDYTAVTLADIEPNRLRRIVTGFGVPFEFDVIGLCAQDHGVPPRDVSHLDYRHRLFAETLDRSPFPHALVYPADQVPETFNRLRCMARAAKQMPAKEIFVMDSGMAAIQGACCDPLCRGLKRFMVLDIATSHTVGAAIIAGEIASFFEYHTHDITAEKLDRLLPALPGGGLDHAKILNEGGHGAYSRRQFDFRKNEIIIATGPRRALMTDCRLPYADGAPWGDNMMTGTVGILEAIRKYKQAG
jgi:uncharacterized protein (DUF1786 family)